MCTLLPDPSFWVVVAIILMLVPKELFGLPSNCRAGQYDVTGDGDVGALTPAISSQPISSQPISSQAISSQAISSRVTPRRCGRRPAGARPMTGAERMRACRARKRAAAASSIGVTPKSSPSPSQPVSLSLFPEDALREDQQEQKTTTRARERDARGDEFPAWFAAWPVPDGRREAEVAYRIARRHVSAEALIQARDRYIAAKPSGQAWKHAAGWLKARRFEDWAEPAVTESGGDDPNVTKIRRVSWLDRRAEWFSTGVWPDDWGPAPWEAGCKMPPNLSQGSRARELIAQGQAKRPGLMMAIGGERRAG